jgi:DNA-binding IclR family transcriptional regulator
LSGDALRALDGSIGTKQISAAVGCHRDTARRRLHELADEGIVEKHKTGESEQSAVLWMLPTES